MSRFNVEVQSLLWSRWIRTLFTFELLVSNIVARIHMQLKPIFSWCAIVAYWTFIVYGLCMDSIYVILQVDFLKWQFSFLLNRFCFLWQFFWLQPQYAYDPIYICTFFPIHPRQIWPLATWMVTALVGFPFLLGKLQFLSKNGKVSFYFSILESTSVYIVRISSH